MADTTSSQTYTQVVAGNLEVEDIFIQLMKASSSKDSLYIKAKESLLAYFASEECTLSERERITALSDLVSKMSVQMTTASLSSAVAIAKENRDGAYQLTKLKEETLLIKEQADKVAADNILTTAQADKVNKDTNNAVIQGWKIQSDMIRENGVTSFPSISTPLISTTNVSDKGLKWEQEQQTKMSVYATIAKSFRESGVVTWTVDPTTNKVSSVTDLYPSAPGLTKAQTDVAIRQKKGFDDNMRQHAANSSANMIGLLLSAEESGAINASDVAQWRTAVGYLNSGGSTSVEPSGIIETTSFTNGGNITKANGITLNGTSVNFTLGTIISIKLTTGTGATLQNSDTVSNVINANGSWTLAVAASHISNLLAGAATIVIYAVDQNGAIIYDKDVVSATLV